MDILPSKVSIQSTKAHWDLTNQTGQPSKVGKTTNTGTLQNDIVIWSP
jgi:hypothetical protein